MNKTLITTILIIGIVSLVNIANAAVSSVTTSASAIKATTGTSITISATVTATSSESGSIQLITSPSGITISDPPGGQYQGVSLSTTPVTKTFTITAGTANTYSYYATSGGTQSTTQTIVFVNPSALTVTGSPSSKSVSKAGDTFSLSISVQNSQSDAVTTSYSLSLPSGYSASGDLTSDTITVSGSSTTTLTWTITTGSSSGTIKFALGDNSNAFSSSVTVPAAAAVEEAAVAAGAPTPGVKVTLQKGKATITVPSIAAGKSAVVNIEKTEDVAFTQIVIFVKNSVNNILVTITKLPGKPATVVQEVTGKVYHYIEVNKTNVTDANINQTNIRFRVEKSWVNANNINETTIALYRFADNAWNKLNTTKSGEDTENILYDAVSPGLSVFAIAGEVKVAPVAPTPAPAPAPPAVPKVPRRGVGLVVTVIVLIAIIAGVVFYLVKKNVIKLGKIFPAKSTRWEELKEKIQQK